MKTQIKRLQGKLKQGSVWIKFKDEERIKYEKDSYIKRIEYLLVTNIAEYSSSIPNTFKITHDERLITDFKITKEGKITYKYDPIWQNSKNYTKITDKEFSIISRIPKEIKTSVTEYITKERKRINDWADSWFNFLKDDNCVIR